MRFSSVFDSILPGPSAQLQDPGARDEALPAATLAHIAPDPQPADDLDERVRRIGEWQLEDW